MRDDGISVPSSTSYPTSKSRDKELCKSEVNWVGSRFWSSLSWNVTSRDTMKELISAFYSLYPLPCDELPITTVCRARGCSFCTFFLRTIYQHRDPKLSYGKYWGLSYSIRDKAYFRWKCTVCHSIADVNSCCHCLSPETFIDIFR